MTIEIRTNDSFNQELLQRVRPADWQNPPPAARYHLVVIGAGTAGLVTAAIAAGLEARVALIERGLMGGDCLNAGCVPSKAILRAARAAAEVRRAHEFGVEVPAGWRVDFPAVMARMRRLRARLSASDSAHRFRDLGVDVFLGHARFASHDTVDVAGAKLHFKKAVIATGTRPTIPPIPGLAESGFLTNENVFALTQLPARLAVIGGGPIGCELAQAFARFGSQVTLLQRGSRLLPRDDPAGATLIEAALRDDGVSIILNANVREVSADRTIHFEHDGNIEQVQVDAILVAVGRTPNVGDLNLKAAGINHDATRGVIVDDCLRTSNRRVFAAGDVCSQFKFTHAADAMARLVVRNALFWGRGRVSALSIPWCTYTDPEIAHVGLTEEDAARQGIAIRTFTQSLEHVDRAVLDGDNVGFVKVHVRANSDRIVGAAIVARHAGDMISELNLARVGKLGLGTLSSVIHPYPTQAEAVRKLGDQYQRTRLTPFTKWLLRKLLG